MRDRPQSAEWTRVELIVPPSAYARYGIDLGTAFFRAGLFWRQHPQRYGATCLALTYQPRRVLVVADELLSRLTLFQVWELTVWRLT